MSYWDTKAKQLVITVVGTKVKNDHRSKFSNLSNWKEEAWKKNHGLNGIRTRDLLISFILHIIVVGTLHKQGREKTGRGLSEKPGGGGKKKHFLA